MAELTLNNDHSLTHSLFIYLIAFIFLDDDGEDECSSNQEPQTIAEEEQSTSTNRLLMASQDPDQDLLYPPDVDQDDSPGFSYSASQSEDDGLGLDGNYNNICTAETSLKGWTRCLWFRPHYSRFHELHTFFGFRSASCVHYCKCLCVVYSWLLLQVSLTFIYLPLCLLVSCDPFFFLFTLPSIDLNTPVFCVSLFLGSAHMTLDTLPRLHRHLFHSKNIFPPPLFLTSSVLFPFPTSPQYFSLICDPFADPIISLHSRDISLYDCHI